VGRIPVFLYARSLFDFSSLSLDGSHAYLGTLTGVVAVAGA